MEAKLFNDGTVASTKLYASVYFCCVTGSWRSEFVRVRRKDLLLADEVAMVTLLKRNGRKAKNLLKQKAVVPTKLIPADQECLLAADDKRMTSAGFCEKLERVKANHLSKHLDAAWKGSK